MTIDAKATGQPTATKMFRALHENVSKVLRGKQEVVRLATACFLAEGHLLIEDLPGTGKTSLAKAMAPVDRRHRPPRPVHPRPVAERHHRGVDLPPQRGRVHASGPDRCSPT